MFIITIIVISFALLINYNNINCDNSINNINYQIFESENQKPVEKYQGYKLIRVSPTTVRQLEYLNYLSNDLNLILPTKKIDFWTDPDRLDTNVDIMVAPEIAKKFQNDLYEHELKPKLLIDNIGSMVEQERKSLIGSSLYYKPKSWVQNETLFFNNYHSLHEIYQFLDDLVEFSDFCSIETIGNSTEKRPLKLLKISSKRYNSDSNIIEKPIIWIDAGLHAREWIAPMTALYIANRLVHQDKDAQQLLDQFDFYILPSANPDGFEYSRQFDRMWRKTRSYNPSFWGLFCRGVDPNRNWNFHWGKTGSSTNPCSEVYHGPNAFSEPETRAMSNYVLNIKDRIKLFISLHSYSQLILTPWGYTHELPREYPDMIQRASEGAQAIKSKTGTLYKIGSSTKVLYAASGGADDWAHGVAGIKYSYTIELRDTGNYGFVLPKEHIIPTGMETFEAIKAMSQSIGYELLQKQLKLKRIRNKSRIP